MASACLTKLYEATILIQGVNLLRFQSQGPAGSKKAKDFQKQHRNDTSLKLPEAFWSEVRCVVDGSAMAPPLQRVTDGSVAAASPKDVVAKSDGKSPASTSSRASTAAPLASLPAGGSPGSTASLSSPPPPSLDGGPPA